MIGNIILLLIILGAEYYGSSQFRLVEVFTSVSTKETQEATCAEGILQMQ